MNLQQIPSHNTEIRKMFTVPEGYCMFGSDFSKLHTAEVKLP